MFNRQSLLGIKPHEINQTEVSRVFQTPEIFGDLTVMENVMIPCFAKRDGAFRMHAIESVGEEVDIHEKAEKMLIDVDMIDRKSMTANSLSRGEPTASMARADTNNTIDLLAKIQEWHHITIAVIEHDMHVVFSLAQKISVLAQGTVIVEDMPENIKGHPKVQEAYLGEAH